jgi:hypothetical protein
MSEWLERKRKPPPSSLFTLYAAFAGPVRLNEALVAGKLPSEFIVDMIDQSGGFGFRTEMMSPHTISVAAADQRAADAF